jgi:hypothetical protein
MAAKWLAHGIRGLIFAIWCLVDFVIAPFGKDKK